MEIPFPHLMHPEQFTDISVSSGDDDVDEDEDEDENKDVDDNEEEVSSTGNSSSWFDGGIAK